MKIAPAAATRRKRKRSSSRRGGAAKSPIRRRTKTKTKKKKANTPFSAADYLSNDGMLTDVWGPAQWHVLHTISFNYPVAPSIEQRAQYRLHLDNLVHVLPCGKCRTNLAENFKKLPLLDQHMVNRDTFSRYVYQLHEHVNAMLGKSSGLSFEQVRDRYEEFRARCLPNSPHTAAASASTTTTAAAENGCTEPLVGVKQRCLMRIVLKDTAGETLTVDKACHVKPTPTTPTSAPTSAPTAPTPTSAPTAPTPTPSAAKRIDR